MTIQAGSVEVELRANLDPLREGMSEATQIAKDGAEQIEKSASGLGNVFDGIGNKAKQEFEKIADSAVSAFEKAELSAQTFKETVNNIGASLKEIGFGAFKTAATAATTSLVRMAKAGVQDTSALENVQIQMIGLTDSVEKGNTAMRMAINYFKNNPFNRFDVTDATKNLVQFGAELDEIPGLLDKLGKVSLSTGAKIDTLAYYYQRMTSDGRINMIDLQQMQTQGIAIFGALAKQLNTTTAGVRELSAQGKLSVEDFKAAFDSLVSDEAMERFEKTLSRQVDRFKGRLSDLRGALAGYVMSQTGDPLQIDENGIYRSYTKLLKKIADTLTSTGSSATETGKSIVQGFQKISQAIGQIIDKISNLVEPVLNIFGKVLNFIGDNSELIIPILGVVLTMITRVAGMLPGVGSIITSVTKPFNALKDSLIQFIKLRPGLSAVIGILAVGFVEAYKNDEEFKKSIQELLGALSELAKSLGSIVKTVLPTLVDAIKAIATSGAVTTILKIAASALAGIAKAIASIPPDNLAMIISFFASIKLLKTNPIILAVSAIALLIGYIKQLADAGENLPEKLLEIGHNMMVGLFNGIVEGAKKVLQFVKDFATKVIDTFKNILRIHSPSQEFYEIGEMITLGLAYGVEDSSDVVQVAMENLAKDTLSLSEKVIKNKVDFGILDIKQEYQEWKKVSKLFTEGSEQYNTAIEKMEDARKQANLKILSLQREYNDALDNTIDKIANMFGLFDEVNLGGGKNANTILKNLDQQIAKMSEWAEAQEIIAGLNLDETLKAELAAMGVAEVGELEAIANMTSDELATLNDMWLKKQSIANDAGIKQMANLKDETLNQIRELKNGIDGETIDIADVGGRLVESISEGIYGAMPTLESAYAQLNDYIAEAQRKLNSGLGSTNTEGEDDYTDPETGVLQEIQGNLENMGAKLKEMIPKILLGMVGAWGLSKIAPKIFNFIASKIDIKGTISGALSGMFGRAATGATKGLATDTLTAILDDYLFNTDDGTLKSRILQLMRDKVTKAEIPEALEETVKNATKATKPAKTIAETTSTVSTSVEQTGQSFSKVNGVFDTIKQGAQAVIWIAGAIAAMAGALWVTYNALKDVDWAQLALDLVAMGVAVAGFGTLAYFGEKLVNIKGILVLIGIAVDIAAVAVACKIAYDCMKDISWGDFANTLSQMAAAVATFGVLNGILGIKVIAIAEGLGLLVSAGIVLEIIAVSKACREAYDTMKDMSWETFGNVLEMMASALNAFGALNAPLGLMVGLEFLGWASVSMICDELIKVSRALVEVDKNVPKDFGSLKVKLQNIKKTLEIINGLDLGTVIGMMVTSWSAEPAERIIKMYVYVAEQLNKLSNISLDKEAIDANLDYIKLTLEGIKAKSDAISGWLEASALDMEASSVENAGRIVIVYGNMVDALDKLANFKPNDGAITESLTKMVGVITILRNSSYGGGGLFRIFDNMDTVANDVDKIKDIVKYYLEMVPTIQDLGKSENQISSTVYTDVIANIRKIKDIVLEIGSVNTGGWVEQKEKDVDKIQSILNKFTELEPVVWQISQMNLDYMSNKDTDPKEKIRKIKEVVLEIGSVDTGGWIDQKESDMAKIQSILNKFTEVAQTTHHFGKENYDVADNAIEWVRKVRDLVWEIGQINQSGSDTLDAKAQIVDKSKTLLTKLAEFSDLMKNIEATDKGSLIETLTSNLNQLILGVENTLTEQKVAFENIGGEYGTALATGVKNQTEAMTGAGQALQSAMWWAIENRMPDEFNQGVEMGNRFAKGVKSVDMTSVGNALQSAVWWSVQNRMQDEYYQGRSLGERLRQGMYDVDYGNAGWWAVEGFKNGAWSQYDSTYNVGWWIANNFLNGLKDRGQQGSPWKTTKESGAWAVEGLIDGLKGSEKALVNEATTLADEVVEALTMDNLTLSPELNARGTYTPTMDIGYGTGYSANGNVIINQSNTNYTQYDIEQVNRDLAWELAKV